MNLPRILVPIAALTLALLSPSYAQAVESSAPRVAVPAEESSNPAAASNAARSSQPSAPLVTLAANSAHPLSTRDQRFFRMAAIGGFTEIEAGKLAVSRSGNEHIKALGQQMVDDHGKANGQLAILAAKKQANLPAAPDARHRAMLASLESKQGRAFDRAFVAEMKAGHAEAIKVFSAAAKSKDADVAAYAASTLPTLKEHARMVAASHSGPSHKMAGIKTASSN